MNGNGLIRLPSGETGDIYEWSFKKSGGAGRHFCTFILPWTTDHSIELIVGAQLTMAGRHFTLKHIEKVQQWDGYDIAVEVIAAAEVEDDA